MKLKTALEIVLDLASDNVMGDYGPDWDKIRKQQLRAIEKVEVAVTAILRKSKTKEKKNEI